MKCIFYYIFSYFPILTREGKISQAGSSETASYIIFTELLVWGRENK